MAGFFEQRIRRQLSEIQKKAEALAEEVSNEVGKEADAYALDIMVPIAKDEVASAFKESVSAWYDAYSPQKYKRRGSLYKVYTPTNPGRDGLGWVFEDIGLDKPSWTPRGSTFNIYEWVFEGGKHGGPVHGVPPYRSTPIPDMFDESVGELQGWIQDQIYAIGQNYFDEHFGFRFQQKFNI